MLGERLNMRRLAIGNVALAIALTLIILISSIGSSEIMVSKPQVLNSEAKHTPDHFTITGFPASVVAGKSFGCITITAYNANGKIVTNYNGYVYFLSTDSKATLPYSAQCEYHFTPGHDKGAHTFCGFNLVTSGSQTITVTDGAVSATTSSISVNHASATQIQIAPKTATVNTRSNQAYTATAKDYYGNSWDVSTISSWSITTGAGGSWSANVYTSSQTGTWTVTGTYLGFTDSASLTVNHGLTTSIVISPKTATLTAGASKSFTVNAFDSYGNNWDVTSLITWRISSGAGGSWNGNTYTSAKANTWTITASLGTFSDTASLTVTPAAAASILISPKNSAEIAGQSLTFTATASDAYGNSWDVSSAAKWSISSGAEGSWNGHTYKSAKYGTWAVTASIGGCSDTASISVDYGPISSLSISPKTATLTAGDSRTFTVLAADVYGNIWDVTSLITWSISSGADGTWIGNQYISSKAGIFTVTATYLGRSDTSSLTVNHALPARIVVLTNTNLATAGSSITFASNAIDNYGNSWSITDSTSWGVDSSAGGSWSGNIYSSAKAGTWIITGQYSSLSGTASLTITHGSQTSLTLSPKISSLSAGSPNTFAALAGDSFGNTWDVTSSTVFTIDSGAGGTWNGNTYNGGKVGTWIISGTCGSYSDTASLSIIHGIATHIQVDPKTPNIVAGSQQTFTTTAFDSYGNSWDSTASATFFIDSQAGGSLSDDVYSSAIAGTWYATAISLGLSDTAQLTVTHASPVSLAISPNHNEIVAGNNQVYSALASDIYSNQWPVTTLTQWSISQNAGGYWNANQYTSSTSGSWTVSGLYLGCTDYAYLTVDHAQATGLTISPKTATITAGSAESYTALASDNYQNSWDISGSVNWAISSGADGTWNNNIYNSANAGNYQVTATLGSLSDSASVAINHGSPISLTISPDSTIIIAGFNQAFIAKASDSSGNTWDVTSSTSWSIDTGASGTWSNNIYTSYTAGDWTVTGTYSGLSSSTSVIVNHSSEVSITVGSSSGSVIAGSSQAFTATASDANGNTWDVTSSTIWAIDSSAGGTLLGNVYTSEFSGVWNITGTFNNISKSVYLTVNHGTATSIQVAPYNITLMAGSNEVYSASATDSYGNTWDVSNSASWSSSQGAAGSWNANTYTAAKVGTWTITAMVGGLLAIAPVIVGHASASSISVLPKTQSFESGSTQSLTALATDSFGNSWDITPTIVWTVDPNAGGSWSSNIYTSAKAGTWTITASLNGLSDLAFLTVTHGQIHTISITPTSSTIEAGTSQSFTANASDLNGNTWDITNNVNWLANLSAGGSWTGNAYTASNSGIWTVTATSNGITGNAQLTVNSNLNPMIPTIDFNHDGSVGFDDAVIIFDAYIHYYNNGTVNPICDLNGDGKINSQDIALFIDGWNTYWSTNGTGT